MVSLYDAIQIARQADAEEVATLRARIGELEAENARLKIECLNGANHLEGIDTSGPGRKRMQSARMWIYQARQLAGEREG